MEFSHIILYVEDVQACLDFYHKAFGLKARFTHESGQYGELDTGQSILAFAAEAMKDITGVKAARNHADEESPGFEIGLMVKDVAAVYKQALAAGAIDVAGPKPMPWGQDVAYVRDPNGVHVAIGSHCDPV